MSKVALAATLGVLLFFTYLTGNRPAYAFAYALCLLFVVAWAWPKLAIRGMTVSRKLDPGTPTVGEAFEETIEVRRRGWVPAPWVEVRDISKIPDYQPGRVISVGNEAVKWNSRGIYRRRGWMAFGPTSLRVSEPFGLFDEEVKLTQRASVLVYPRVRPIPDLLTPSAQQIGNSQSFGAWVKRGQQFRVLASLGAVDMHETAGERRLLAGLVQPLAPHKAHDRRVSSHALERRPPAPQHALHRRELAAAARRRRRLAKRVLRPTHVARQHRPRALRRQFAPMRQHHIDRRVNALRQHARAHRPI